MGELCSSKQLYAGANWNVKLEGMLGAINKAMIITSYQYYLDRSAINIKSVYCF